MINAQIYQKLAQLIPNMEERLHNNTAFGKSVSEGFMDLHFDSLGKDATGAYHIALAHYFEQNGDLVPDPDMRIRIDTVAKTAQALSFQNMYVYQEVNPDLPDTDQNNNTLKKELNLFLSDWLNNALNQGHVIDFTKADAEAKHERTAPKRNTNPDISDTR